MRLAIFFYNFSLTHYTICTSVREREHDRRLIDAKWCVYMSMVECVIIVLALCVCVALFHLLRSDELWGTIGNTHLGKCLIIITTTTTGQHISKPLPATCAATTSYQLFLRVIKKSIEYCNSTYITYISWIANIFNNTKSRLKKLTCNFSVNISFISSPFLLG